ncbi:hypothetical protein EAG_11684 [Camponotus floridanus]|uniref:Uncharacterized protein n=1 Tax=Camponotus floridanus TaxID=104421 RepID=E2AG01_CAMFO|nr:hypothetical protein EAG_11684 [Camponotus floridanus]
MEAAKGETRGGRSFDNLGHAAKRSGPDSIITDEKLGPVNLKEQRRGARETQRMTKLTTRSSHSKSLIPREARTFGFNFSADAAPHAIDNEKDSGKEYSLVEKKMFQTKVVWFRGGHKMCESDAENTLLYPTIYLESITVQLDEKAPHLPFSVASSLWHFAVLRLVKRHGLLRDMSAVNITKGMCSSHMGNMCLTHTRVNACRLRHTNALSGTVCPSLDHHPNPSVLTLASKRVMRIHPQRRTLPINAQRSVLERIQPENTNQILIEM